MQIFRVSQSVSDFGHCDGRREGFCPEPPATNTPPQKCSEQTSRYLETNKSITFSRCNKASAQTGSVAISPTTKYTELLCMYCTTCTFGEKTGEIVTEKKTTPGSGEKSITCLVPHAKMKLDAVLWFSYDIKLRPISSLHAGPGFVL